MPRNKGSLTSDECCTPCALPEHPDRVENTSRHPVITASLGRLGERRLGEIGRKRFDVPSQSLVVNLSGRELSTEIIESCRSGDRDAFRVLYDLHKDRVYSIALYFFGGDPAVASDVTQQVFLKLMTSIHQFSGDAEFSALQLTSTANSRSRRLSRSSCTCGNAGVARPSASELAGEWQWYSIFRWTRRLKQSGLPSKQRFRRTGPARRPWPFGGAGPRQQWFWSWPVLLIGASPIHVAE